MIIEDLDLEEYPYEGEFYETRVTGEDEGLLEQGEESVLVLRTRCDIQQASLLGNAGFKVTSYNVYMPMEVGGAHAPRTVVPLQGQMGGEESSLEVMRGVVVRRGMTFRGEARGYRVDGVVEGVGWSELGGCVVQIKDRTE